MDEQTTQALQVVDGNGELTTIEIPDSKLEIFARISEQPVTAEQAQILLAPVDENEIDILPTGEVYLPQVHYRARLNHAFHPGGWAMRPLSHPYIRDDIAVQEWAMYVGGRFISAAVGSAEYQEENRRMNWGDVLETLKSNALMRLCKDLGIAAECWDRRFTRNFQEKYCIRVFVKNTKNDQTKVQWRRLDAPPFNRFPFEETGAVPDSPNKEKWVNIVNPTGDAKKQVQATAKTTPKAPVASDATKATPTVAQPPAVVASTPESSFPVIEPTKTGDFDKGKPATSPAPVTEVKPETVTVSLGSMTLMKNAKDIVSAKGVEMFSKQFVGEGKAFAHPNHVKNHVRKYFRVDNVSEMTWEKFVALVGCALVKAGNEKGHLDPKWYAELIKETIGDAPIDVGPITAESAETDAVAIVELWSNVAKDVETAPVLQAVFGVDNVSVLDDDKRRQVWLLLKAVGQGVVAATIADMTENLKLG